MCIKLAADVKLAREGKFHSLTISAKTSYTCCYCISHSSVSQLFYTRCEHQHHHHHIIIINITTITNVIIINIIVIIITINTTITIFDQVM